MQERVYLSVWSTLAILASSLVAGSFYAAAIYPFRHLCFFCLTGNP
jgi:hypothetical protein